MVVQVYELTMCLYTAVVTRYSYL